MSHLAILGSRHSVTRHSLKCVVVSISAVVVAMCACQAHASWTVTRLGQGQARSTFGGQQVGSVGGSAALWNGTASSLLSLHPAGATESAAFFTTGIQQVGFARVSDRAHASLWGGTAGSWVDLHPLSAVGSTAYGAAGNQQVGWVAAEFDGATQSHAALWNGTASSWTDLNPLGASSSEAWATTGAKQAGYVETFSGQVRASLWSGTAASWINLHPADAEHSQAFGAYGLQQVGVASFGGVGHASLWSGTASSWIDLHPPGAFSSGAQAIHSSYQVGTVSLAAFGPSHASLWTGTAASWQDLHAVLPSEFLNSSASAVWSDSGVIHVVGNGTTAAGHEALLWTWVVPPPSTLVVFCFAVLPVAKRRR